MSSTSTLSTSVMSSTSTLSTGVRVNGEFTFFSTRDSSTSTLKIIKEETTELTYVVAIAYLGMSDHRPRWSVQLRNRHNGTECCSSYRYGGSRQFVFKPSGAVLEIEETDEYAIERKWVDMSVNPHFESMTPLTVDDRIQSLIAKAKIFTPNDEKAVKKIFYHNAIGVILYARDQRWNMDIYLAKADSEDFTKCESQMQSQCRCPDGDGSWKVTVPGEASSHCYTENSHSQPASTTWDGTPLRQIIL